jgi:uncharacterized protein (DUF934 family)
MGMLMDILAPNTSRDIITANYTEWIPYQEWVEAKKAEYVSKSGPVSVRIDKAECERLLTDLDARRSLGQVSR